MRPEKSSDVSASSPDALRAWGLALPAVRALVASLPEGDARPNGLHLDVARAPWIRAAGESRVSLVRVMSVHRGEAVLVGQLQVTEREAAGAPSRALRAYIHDAARGWTREVEGVDAWWLAVLERHYARGAPPLDLDGPASA